MMKYIGLDAHISSCLFHVLDSFLIQDFVRLKNRYKAIFRSQGIHQKGTAVYSDESFLKGIKKGHARFIGKLVYDIISVFEEKRKEYLQELAKQQRKFPEIRLSPPGTSLPVKTPWLATESWVQGLPWGSYR